jgi:hypothetical protein
LAFVILLPSGAGLSLYCDHKDGPEMKMRLLALVSALGALAAFLGDVPWPH